MEELTSVDSLLQAAVMPTSHKTPAQRTAAIITAGPNGTTSSAPKPAACQLLLRLIQQNDRAVAQAAAGRG